MEALHTRRLHLPTPRNDSNSLHLWVVRVGGDNGELRPWHYIHVLSIERSLMMGVKYNSYVHSYNTVYFGPPIW